MDYMGLKIGYGTDDELGEWHQQRTMSRRLNPWVPMWVSDDVVAVIPGKGEYENCLEDGAECEYLNGVGLRDGCYCKHYKRARDWSDKSVLDNDGRPIMQHFCAKDGNFMGYAYCCGTFAKCYEPGKSAGVKRLLSQIRKRRVECNDLK